MNEDHFEDMRGSGDLAGFGVLGGDAIASHHKATAKMSPDGQGIDYKLDCGHCGVPNRLTVSWGEFLYAANSQIPFDQARRAPWKYEQQFGGFHPNVGCAQCQMVLLLLITPDEAKRHLHGAEQAGKLPRGWTQAQSQALVQRAGSGYQR
jgi:hypothetical protein